MSRVNILTASYKTPPDLLEKSYQSILSQNYTNYKPIFVEDYFGCGPGATRNQCLSFLDKDCEYICLLDSDDYLEPNSLKCRVDFLDSHPDIIAVYGNKFNEKDGVKSLEISKQYDETLLQRECFIPSCSIMWRTEPFVKYIGKFLEDIFLAEDYNVWLKLAYLGRIAKIEEPIYTQVLHGGNITMSPNKLKNHFRDLQTCYMDYHKWKQTI